MSIQDAITAIEQGKARLGQPYNHHGTLVVPIHLPEGLIYAETEELA